MTQWDAKSTKLKRSLWVFKVPYIRLLSVFQKRLLIPFNPVFFLHYMHQEWEVNLFQKEVFSCVLTSMRQTERIYVFIVPLSFSILLFERMKFDSCWVLFRLDTHHHRKLFIIIFCHCAYGQRRNADWITEHTSIIIRHTLHIMW